MSYIPDQYCGSLDWGCDQQVNPDYLATLPDLLYCNLSPTAGVTTNVQYAVSLANDSELLLDLL